MIDVVQIHERKETLTVGANIPGREPPKDDRAVQVHPKGTDDRSRHCSRRISARLSGHEPNDRLRSLELFVAPENELLGRL